MTNADAASAATGDRGSGTLAEPQVRGMFDRISRIYDRLNTVMTAGLHHRWRRRAADLAQLGPGVAVSTSRRVPGTSRSSWRAESRPAARSSEWTFRADARRGAGKAERSGLPSRHWASNGRTRWSSTTPTIRFDAATVGFGVRNFSDSTGGSRELARVVRAGGHVVILEVTKPQRPPLSSFFSFWFDRAVPVLGRVAATPTHTPISQLGPSLPGPRRAGSANGQGGDEDVRYVITAGGIIALHVGTAGPGDWSR